MRNWATAVTAFLSLAASEASTAFGTTYALPSDYGVACVELATGKVLWRRPGTFTLPLLKVEAGRLVVQDPPPRRRTNLMDPLFHQPGKGAAGQKAILDLATGEPAAPISGAVAVEPLGPVPASLRMVSGKMLAFDRGNTRHIETADGTVLKRLEWYPDNIVVAGDLVILTMGDDDAGSADVYAWDLSTGAFAWEIDLHRHVRNLPAGAHIDLALDGGRLLVSVDERLLAFALKRRPRLLWRTRLPRQPIRVYDSAWTQFGRHGAILFARVYEDLFALRASDGKLLWQFDAGMLGDPWPVVHDGWVCMSYRAGTVKPMSWSIPGDRGREVRALRINRSGVDRWSITPLAWQRIPARGRVWSHLDQPPASNGSATAIVLTLYDSDGETITIDLTTALTSRRTAFVKFHGLYERAEVRAGDRLLAKSRWD
jgi:outer membrane protein assembly factor BamB